MTDAQVDLRAELEECLSILGELADSPIWHRLSAERQTACWQIIELVQLLLVENEAAWESVQFLRGLVKGLQEDMAKRDERIWTPGSGGSSGQSRSPRRARRS